MDEWQSSAQVAERLMAADCKSATLRVTEVRILPCAPFPFLLRKRRGVVVDFSPAGTGRMVVALGVFAVLGLSAYLTMEPGKYRTLTMVLLAFFAFRVVPGRLRAR